MTSLGKTEGEKNGEHDKENETVETGGVGVYSEQDVINETAKADKDCKNMVLRKGIVDGRVGNNKEHSAKGYRHISLSS